jgi:hypothetical protein
VMIWVFMQGNYSVTRQSDMNVAVQIYLTSIPNLCIFENKVTVTRFAKVTVT